MKAERVIHFLKKNNFLWIALIAYIALKFVVNPQPVLTIEKDRVQVGIFNFKESPPGQPSLNPIFEINPIWKMSAYQINLEGGVSLKPLSRDRQGVFHLMGTDHLGRDVMAGFICGMEIAILLGLLVSLGTGLLCVLMGSMSAYFDRFPFRISAIERILWILLTIAFIGLLCWKILGATNPIVWVIYLLVLIVTWWVSRKYTRPKKYILPIGGFNRRLQEVFQPLPDLVILLVLMAVFNQIGFGGLVILLIFLRLPSGAWFIQGRAQQIVVQPHIDQVKAMAIPGQYVILRHIIPLLMPFARVFMSLTAARAVLSESALSFLGLGPTGEWMSWGSMIRIGLANFAIWWVAFFPIVGLVALTLVFRIGKK